MMKVNNKTSLYNQHELKLAQTFYRFERRAKRKELKYSQNNSANQDRLLAYS